MLGSAPYVNGIYVIVHMAIFASNLWPSNKGQWKLFLAFQSSYVKLIFLFLPLSTPVDGLDIVGNPGS
jgi:hypothetical protein